MYELFIRFVSFPLGSSRISWNEHGFDKLVQFIQIQIGEDGTDNGPLGATAVGLVPAPIFEISRFEESTDETHEAFILDGFSQDGEQQFMRKRVETFRDIALYEPNRSHPVVVDFPQCRVTSAFWSEPMGMGAKLRLKVGVENEAHDFLQQFIRPGLNAKRTFPTILFRDVDAPGGFPSISLVPHSVNDRSDFVCEVDSQRGPLLPVSDCPFPNRACMFPCTRATHTEVWRGTTDFAFLGNSFHRFSKICPSLSRMATRRASRITEERRMPGFDKTRATFLPVGGMSCSMSWRTAS